MNEYTLLENIFSNEQLFLIAATSIPEVDINYNDQTISFNTTKTYNRAMITEFLTTSFANIETFKDTFNNSETEMTEAQKANITWITDQLRKLEQYLNTQ